MYPVRLILAFYGDELMQMPRYELNGTPLPFARDVHFDSLFPSPSANRLQSASSQPGHRIYDPKSPAIKTCPRCGSTRVFECQLVPHLISVLEHEAEEDPTGTAQTKISSTGDTESTADVVLEKRKKELEMLLKGGEGKRGMEWGTAMIFSCEKDCSVQDGKGAKQTWAEELVLVQWEE